MSCVNKIINNDPNSLVILFEVVGGVGDMLIAANYLWHFKEKFGTDHIHYDITSNNRQGINTVFKENDLIDSIYITINDDEKRDLFSRYDMVVSIRRYPKIMKYDVPKISQYCPKLFEYIHTIALFTDCNARLIKGGIFDAQGALIEISKGRKRIQQIDVNSYLGITEEFKYPWFWDLECTILAQHNLIGVEYITVHRGNDTRYTKDSIKLWPVAYYDILLTKIKEKYPTLVIVQLGVSYERCPLFKNVDIDLIEKTSLEDVKHLLKYSKVHIDCEGGFVHIRHAIHGGKSIVLFGPTSDQFYGYSENINLHGTGCPTFCEWCTEGWQEKCIRGHKNNPCMQSIIPEQVFDKFVDLYEGRI